MALNERLNVYETVIGYASHIRVGGYWSTGNGILLFTTERMVAAKAHGLWDPNRLRRDCLQTGLQVDVEELLFKSRNNFAIHYAEMIELRVTKPGIFLTGKVTVRTAHGEKVLRIESKERSVH